MRLSLSQLCSLGNLLDLLSNLVHQVGGWTVGNDKSVGQWGKNALVDQLGTVGAWQSDVEQEQSLEQEVCWDPVENGLGPELNDLQGSKHNPVSQQLGVVSAGSSLQRLQGQVAWKSKPGKVTQQLANPAKV